MIRRISLGLLAAALLLPATAKALVTVEGFYGIARPPSADFHTAASGAGNASVSSLYSSSLQNAGGDVLLGGGLFQLGAIGDITWKGNNPTQSAIGALAGLRFDLGGLRLDALAEAGGHRYGNFAKNPQVVTASTASEWLPYVGLRPGVAFKVYPGVFVGVWGFARWDLTRKDVTISASSTSPGFPAKLGGTTIGATLRLGLDF
jgi:hypothetical protein